jgi:hypothetical protein
MFSPMSQKPGDRQEPTGMTTEISDVATQKQYLTGLRLFTLLGGLTLVTFLVLLDTSIIGTVRIISP